MREKKVPTRRMLTANGVELVGAEPTNTLQETYIKERRASSFSQLTFYPSRHTKQPRQVSRNGTLVDTCFTETVVASLGFPLDDDFATDSQDSRTLEKNL